MKKNKIVHASVYCFIVSLALASVIYVGILMINFIKYINIGG